MKTVTLFRHAKSGDKDNPAVADIDRPLAERGEEGGAEDGRGDARSASSGRT